MSLNPSQIAPLPGYPQQWGTKNVEFGELAGPLSYATGGQTITASTFGWGAFDSFEVNGLSYSGTYRAKIQYLPIDAAPSKQNQSMYQVKVEWIVDATGSEVAALTDLSGEIFRFFAVSI